MLSGERIQAASGTPPRNQWTPHSGPVGGGCREGGAAPVPRGQSPEEGVHFCLHYGPPPCVPASGTRHDHPQPTCLCLKVAQERNKAWLPPRGPWPAALGWGGQSRRPHHHHGAEGVVAAKQRRRGQTLARERLATNTGQAGGASNPCAYRSCSGGSGGKHGVSISQGR